MCIPAAATAPILGALISGGAAYSNARNNRRAVNQGNARQVRQINQNIIENQRDFDSQNRRQNLEFIGQQESAERSRAIEEQQRLGEQQALEPLGQLENFQENLDQETQEQRQVFRDDLDSSIAAGNQNIGSGLEGNVSEAFTEASGDAQQDSLSKARTLGDRRARIAGVSGLLQDDTRAVADAGQATNATNFAIQRQREIEQYLRQLAQNRADVESRIAPASVQVI